jgi:hypothetical protein
VGTLPLTPKQRLGWRSFSWQTATLSGVYSFLCYSDNVPLISGTCRNVVNGLRDEDDESLYTGRNSIGSEYSTQENGGNMQVFVKGHGRTSSKGSQTSFMSRKKMSGAKSRPETKVRIQLQAPRTLFSHSRRGLLGPLWVPGANWSPDRECFSRHGFRVIQFCAICGPRRQQSTPRGRPRPFCHFVFINQ